MSTLKTVVEMVKGAFEGNKFKPVKLLPPALLLCTALRRPGLSAMEIMADFTQELSKIGVPVGKNTDGSQNLILASFYAYTKVFLKHLKLKAAVKVAFKPMSITSTGTGANGGGPVVVKSVNDNIVTGDGTIS